jgi:hypothetical protein
VPVSKVFVSKIVARRFPAFEHRFHLKFGTGNLDNGEPAAVARRSGAARYVADATFTIDGGYGLT